MDDESQRLGLLPLPTRKTQLTYDRAPPLVVLVSFSHCALRWVEYNGGVGLVILFWWSRSRGLPWRAPAAPLFFTFVRLPLVDPKRPPLARGCSPPPFVAAEGTSGLAFGKYKYQY